MGGESNEGDMGLNYDDDESGISKVGTTSVLSYEKILVLSPSRELATQTEKTIQSIGVHTNIRAQACIGGKSIAEDIKKLERGVHDVSGTPGEMLSKGFKDHIYKAYRYDVHVCFISCYFSSRDPEDDKQVYDGILREYL
ncbi:hypothetical protein F2Q68_00032402 [Brassica cretica]|uniref:DEAD/DEAH-box helicase domain-containing protein n=1 Tax=Brassica cretica TaxID=69181 RepID=A0A8S9GLD3_BRACR|nr:hypothetical protein F2Q68_00032402 [Brassica cretica]